MPPVYSLPLRATRKAWAKLFGPNQAPMPLCDSDPDSVSAKIRALLEADAPAMIARFGSTELECLENYLAVKHRKRDVVGFVTGKTNCWWWNPSNIEKMKTYSGFFPPERTAVEKFCELMLQDIPLVDLLGSWLPEEALFERELSKAQMVEFELLNPYFAKIPWTRALAGRKVLVIHPFASTVESQYAKREKLFADDLLPAFELSTIKAVQGIAGEQPDFPDWFAALKSMTDAMDATDYDICLIGAGAYGFPLAAHAKRRGKKGFHLGGSLQLLFGIRGKRWENPDYNPKYNFARLMNEHWTKPGEEDRPKKAELAEGACYW